VNSTRVDNIADYYGSANDAKITFTGTQLQVQSDLVTATDSLLLRGGTAGVILNVGATAQHTITSLTDTLADGLNFVVGSTTGTKIGTTTTQKLSFWNATPIVQPANTVAIDTLLVNTGLRASGGSANFDTKIVNGLPQNLKAYTVATLPAGTTGDIAYVTDALLPAFLTTIAGGGAVVTPVFYNGANWVAY
jgi:hypothetical protein